MFYAESEVMLHVFVKDDRETKLSFFFIYLFYFILHRKRRQNKKKLTKNVDERKLRYIHSRNKQYMASGKHAYVSLTPLNPTFI